MDLPKHIASLSADRIGSETSNTRFYLYIGYLVVGFALAVYSNGHNFLSNYLMLYFFGFGIAGMITYHLYAKNPMVGITFSSDSIRIQPTLFKKRIIPLDEIDSVSIHLSSIQLKLKTNQIEKIELSNYPFGAVRELKECFHDYSLQNKIECTIK